MKKKFVLFIIIICMIFSVYSYKLRTAYNCDKFEDKNSELTYNISVLTYALSIVPDEVKGEVFKKSIQEKFPKIEKDLLKTLSIAQEEVEEAAVMDVEGQITKEDKNLSSVMNYLIEN